MVEISGQSASIKASGSISDRKTAGDGDPAMAFLGTLFAAIGPKDAATGDVSSEKMAFVGDANIGDANIGDANIGDANIGDANISDANISDANTPEVAYWGAETLDQAAWFLSLRAHGNVALPLNEFVSGSSSPESDALVQTEFQLSQDGLSDSPELFGLPLLIASQAPALSQSWFSGTNVSETDLGVARLNAGSFPSAGTPFASALPSGTPSATQLAALLADATMEPAGETSVSSKSVPAFAEWVRQFMAARSGLDASIRGLSDRSHGSDIKGLEFDQFWATKWAARLDGGVKDAVYTVQSNAIFRYQLSYEAAGARLEPSLAHFVETMPPQTTVRDLQMSLAMRMGSDRTSDGRPEPQGSSSGGFGGNNHPPTSFLLSSTLNSPSNPAGLAPDPLDAPQPDFDQLDLMQKDWEKKLSERIGRAIADGLDEIELEMNPRNLGRVHVQLNLDGQEVRVRLLADNGLAANLLNDSEHRLYQQMESMGMRLSYFYSGQDRSNGGQSGQPRNGSASSKLQKQASGTGQETEDLVKTARNVHSYGINVTA